MTLMATHTQFWNLTRFLIGFLVLDCVVRIPDLPPYKHDTINKKDILEYIRDLKGNWEIRILVNGEYSEITISSWHLLKCVRIVFEYVGDVFRVSATFEKGLEDYVLHGCFGFMRNAAWDARKRIIIREIKLRKKNHHKQELKASYEEGKEVHYSVPFLKENESTPQTSATSWTSADSTHSHSHNTLEKVPMSSTVTKSQELRKKGELNVSTTVFTSRTEKHPRHMQKVTYGKGKKDDYPAYGSTVNVNVSTPHTSAGSRISADYTNSHNHTTVVKAPPVSSTIPESPDLRKKLELSVSTTVSKTSTAQEER